MRMWFVMTTATKYDTNWLLNQVEHGVRPKYVFFWGHRSKADGQITKACFSQWWPSTFQIDDQSYLSAEHWMMAEKARLFGDLEVEKKILNVSKPGAAKALGRQVRNFKQDVWIKHRFEIVVRGNVQKFSQNPELGAFLIGTGKRVLVEASPVDKIWGIGLEQSDKKAENPRLWKGDNLLGFALMVARDQLSK